MADNKHQNKFVLHLLGWFFLGLFSYFLIREVDFHQLYLHLNKVPTQVMVLLLFLQLLTQLLLGLQWYLISKKIATNTTFSKIMLILTMGSVIEGLTPGAKVGGEVTRLHYLKREFSCTTVQATHIIIIQKSISMSALMLVSLYAFLYLMRHVRHFIPQSQQYITLALTFTCIIFFLSCIFFSGALATLFQRSKLKMLRKLSSVLSEYHKNISRLNLPEIMIQFLISFCVWLLFPLKMVILVASFDIHVNPVLLFCFTMTSYMIGMLPLTPGGIGTFEASIVALFSLLPIPTELSFSIALVFRFVTFWFVIIASSLFALIHQRRRIFVKK